MPKPTPQDRSPQTPPAAPSAAPVAPPAIALINLAIFAFFMVTAGVGTLVPPLVKDRLPEQFRPLWQRLLATPDDEWNIVGESIAISTQWAIGLAELSIGALALAALVSPALRPRFANLALCGATALFGTFMLVLFFLHEADLPKWNQYPGLLLWIAATWALLRLPAQRT